MRSALVLFIGFTAFVLCPTACPMEAEMAASGHMMEHDMHASTDAMQHDHTEKPCEHCEANDDVTFALLNGISSFVEFPAVAFIAIPQFSTPVVEYVTEQPPLRHRLARGPTVVPNIVRTVVLRS